MLNIFVNYTINKKTNKVNVLTNEVVFVDMPIAIAEYQREYENPIIVTVEKRNYVMEKEEYDELVKKRQEGLKEFQLIIEKDTGAVREANETDDVSKIVKVKLPIDTDFTEIFFRDGNFVKLEKEEAAIEI